MEFDNVHSLRRCFQSVFPSSFGWFGAITSGSWQLVPRFVFSGKKGLTGGLDHLSFGPLKRVALAATGTPALVTENGQ
jgi:hypothetical protein